MTVVAVLGEKGGTGKTTFAANLAGMRANAGRSVLMIDADRQGSSSYWADERARLEDVAAVDCIQQYGSGLARRIRRMSQSYDDIVIDVGAGDGVEMKLVLDVADCAVTPVKPAGVDVWTMGLMNNLVGQALEDNSALTCWAVVNMAPTDPRNKDVERTVAALGQLQAITVADVVVHNRVAYARSVPAGLTVEEMKPRPMKAYDEFVYIYDMVFGEKAERSRSNSQVAA